MTPIEVTIALLLTFLATHIVDWVLSPVPQRRPIVVAACLVLSFVFVVVSRGGG